MFTIHYWNRCSKVFAFILRTITIICLVLTSLSLQANIASAQQDDSPLPIITVIGPLSDFASPQGQPSEAQSYLVSATGLLSDLIITPSAGFEVSLTQNGDFVGSSESLQLIADADGILNEIVIYVRMNPDAAAVFSGSIRHESGDAEPALMAVKGSSVPMIMVTSDLAEFSAPVGSLSDSQTYLVSGMNLTDEIVITTSEPFGFLKDGELTATMNIAPIAGEIKNSPVEVAFQSETIGSYKGSLIHTSANADPVEIPVTASAEESALLTLEAARDDGPITLAATTISFTGEELLGRPTDTSVTVNIIPDSAIEYHYDYGTTSEGYTGSTGNITATAGQPSEVVISGLTANTRYYYRMQYHLPGETDWVDRTEHSFMTQRAEGNSFSFAVTSDNHANFSTTTQNTMTNILNEQPDFLVDLGDTFMIDGLTTQTAVNNNYLAYRNPLFFDKIGSSIPIFLASGNHEEEEGWNLDDGFSLAQADIQARKLFFPTPITDGFYSGNTDPLAAIDESVYGDELREDYYAWTWGDALFVVIDPFQYTMNLPYSPGMAGEGTDDSKTGDQWSWTLGAQQFQWFKQTLQNSDAKYKFIFSHQMLGGIPEESVSGGAGYVRGGAEAAEYFEWGGKNADGSDGFAAHRDPDDFGTTPIHQLMVANGVTAYFHGHDHQYVYEKTADGIVYQEVPSPGWTGGGFSGIYFEGDHGTYSTIKILPNNGHLLVTVTGEKATVDYISASSTSGSVNYSYDIEPSTPDTTPPEVTINQASTQDDPTTGPTVNFEVNFSESVSDFATGDVTFGGTASPTNAEVTGSGATYNVAVSGMTSSGIVIAGIDEGVATDASGNANEASTSIDNEVTFDAGATLYGTVTQDGATSSGTMDDTSTLSFSHTTGTGTNRLMLVGASWNPGSATPSISTVTFTYGDKVLNLSQKIVQEVTASSGKRYSAIWYSDEEPPLSTTGTVTITFSGSVSNGAMAGAANFAGVDQTTPLGTAVGAYNNSGSTTATVTLTGLTGNELVFDNVFHGASSSSQTLTAGADQTRLWFPDYVANIRAAASIEQATSSSVTMSWTATSSTPWTIAAVPINPAEVTSYNLAVAVSPGGSGTTNPSVGTHEYAEGSVVNITPTPALGYAFDHWDGDCTGSGTCQVTMDGNKSVTANFTAIPTYTLTTAVSPSGSGTITPAAGSHTYNQNEVVSVTAAYNSGYEFSHWSGACTGSGTCSVTMDADKSVTANFVEVAEVTLDGAYSSGTMDDAATLSFSHTTGTGNNRLMLVGVSWNSGSSTASITSVIFTYGSEEINLTQKIVQESASSAGRFSAIWYSPTEPPPGTTGTVTITFSASVTNGAMAGAANFAGVNQTTPLGTAVGANSSSTGTAATVTLTGLTGNELVFDNLFQGAGDSGQTLTVGAGQTQLWYPDYVANIRASASIEQATNSSVTMSWTASSASVWAIAAVPIIPAPVTTTYDLTIATDGNGATTPTAGTHTYDAGDIVDVTATPGTGYEFDHWSGDCSGSGSCQVTMDADKSVTAHFVLIKHTLTITVVGNGSTTPASGSHEYDYGTEVDVTQLADSGNVFSGWSGDCTGSGTCHLVMDEDKAVTATFTETSAPTVTINQAASQADPTNASEINFTVVFSEPVADFETGDVIFSGAGATTATVTGSETTYNVAVSGMTSSGTVTASIAAGVAHDGANNPNMASTSTDNSVVYDISAPAATIEQAVSQNDPSNEAAIDFTVTFSEAVVDFVGSDVSVSGTTGANLATVTGSGATYNVAVSGMTNVGSVIITIPTDVAHDAAGNANTATTNVDNTVQYDNAAPTVTINQAAGQADPTNASSINFTVVFSEAVTDFATGDVTFSGAGATTATVTGGGTTYNVAVSGMTGSGTITASLAAGVAHDAAGNASTASTTGDNSVAYDSVAPTVSINQASGQADPTNTGPINYTVIFSETVTDFATGDVNLGGTAGATTATITGGGTTYNVAVSGMTGSGTVTATVPAGAAHDAAGNSSAASTSSDITVTYDVVSPTVTINQAAGQADPTGTAPINFTVTYSESVTEFVGSDVTLGGTSNASSATVTGSGTTYNVAVSGMTTSGTVIASLAAGVAHDAAGNLSAVSTYTDNSVTYNYTPPEITFTGTEFLGRPEANSISISAVPDDAIQLYYEYGTTSGDYPNSSSTVSAAADESVVVTLTGLTANTKYYYRMRYSPDGGANWISRPEHTFMTQRAEGSTYSFTITSDAHVDIMLGNAANWTTTLNDIVNDQADFEIDLGDTVAMDDGTNSVALGDIAAAEQVYKDTLPFFNIISGSSPLFILAGNHEQQEAWHLQGTLANSLPVMGKNAEKEFFLNPVPDSFYSGNETTYPYLAGDQLIQDYYAWTWGDALFVVISPFWTTTTKPYTTTVGGGETDATGSGDRWDWTLGLEQFNWLKSTLENSDAEYKFIFAHQIVGGNSLSNPDQVNYGHGGVDSANLVEWGGYNVGGTTWGWDTERPGWGTKPIHQILVDNGVTAFFHGHDHQYGYEKMDGVVYQSVPSASFSNNFGIYTTGGNDGKTIRAASGSGHLLVTVSPSQAEVKFFQTGSSTSTYTYNMTPTVSNNAPVLGAVGNKTVAELATLSFTATATDDGLPTGSSLAYSLAAGTTAVPSGATINPTSGVFSWTPTEAQGAGTYNIQVCVSDSALSDCETINITVSEVNVAPVLAAIGNKSVAELSALTFTATATDADQPANALTYSLAAGTTAVPTGASINPASGAFSWTPTEAQGAGTYNIQVCVSDGAANDCETINLTVTEVNAAPVITEGATATVAMSTNGAPTPFALTLNATDADLPANSLTWSILTQASHGSASASGTGASKAIGYTPAVDYTGADSFVVQVSDGSLTDTITVNVNITTTMYTVSVTISGLADVTVTSDPAGISCTNGVCSHDFAHGTVVTLTATPTSSYYRLKNWSGDCTGSGTCSLTVTSAKAVTAEVETSTFADVPFDYTETIGLVNYNFHPYIQALYDGGFTSGCGTSPLRYCPANDLTRAEAAVFMLRGLMGTTYAPEVPDDPYFTADDYTGSGSWAQAWVEAMYSEGLSAGCGVANSYCPWVPLARDEASVFALRVKNGNGWSPSRTPTGIFADVDTGYWGAAWVEQAYIDGLLPACGYDDELDKPIACVSSTVSRGLAAYMIVKAKGLALPD